MYFIPYRSIDSDAEVCSTSSSTETKLATIATIDEFGVFVGSGH